MKSPTYRCWDKVKHEMFNVGMIIFLGEETHIFKSEGDQSWSSSKDSELMLGLGIRDSEGTKVFEGDILADDRGGLYEVVFKEGSHEFRLVDCNKTSTNNQRIWKKWIENSRVTGNRWQQMYLTKRTALQQNFTQTL